VNPSRLSRAWRIWLALPEVIRIAAVILLLVLFGLAWPAHAAQSMLARTPTGDTVRLVHEPCKLTAHGLFPQGIPAGFEAASAVIDGKRFAGCWALLPNGIVLVLFEDGDVGEIPAAAFRAADT
jgi:hypothetical protein